MKYETRLIWVLTITFGFGSGLFSKDGHDRFGLVRLLAVVDRDVGPGEGQFQRTASADPPRCARHQGHLAVESHI